MNAPSLNAAIFDWAGTLVDFGSRAPLRAFMQVFANAGIAVDEAETRIPMGTEKKEHIRRMLQQARIRDAWREQHGRFASEEDIDALYTELAPIQRAEIDHHSTPVPGAAALFSDLRARGFKLGSTTGYSRGMIDGMLEKAAAADIQPDCVVAADEAAGARPGPAAALKNVIALEIGSVAQCVKVDDTSAGILEGRNAGMWTVAVVLSGNALGLSHEAWERMDEAQQTPLRQAAYRKMAGCGAHYLIDDIRQLEPVLVDIDRRLALGERP
ncbi:phosphonoacetaldehyde hydrolase [Microbulbifer sp. Q7]|uniref:phosphonoacetaldehyde hydrolase n=1 Tax=Microbulbifer sp. Q7 TaxID=1785091 RepID=UPI00082C1E52|nr:phosphonoacetaldehyde hydrolase [Microbulbifer sp. Q7]